jgi:hypothetical protein
LEQKRVAMAASHRHERRRLDEGQQERWQEEAKARAARIPSGVRGLWNRLTGQHAVLQKQNEREAYGAMARDRAQRQTLIEAQMRDRQALQVEIKSVRDRHAALLRELRTDQQQIKRTLEAPPVMKEFEAQAKPASKAAEQPRQPAKPTTQERLDRLREGRTENRPSGHARGKSPDRER